MCRLFAQVSLVPRSAADYLVDAEFSLLNQSHAKRGCLQRDGWGLGWHDARGRAVVRRSPNPIYKEAALLRETAQEAVAPIVIGHVRAASNPLKLPQSKLITVENTQPFTDGAWIFAHNGTLNIPREIMAALGRLKSRLRSNNDSEVYFWHLLKHLRKASGFAQAARQAMLELWDIWDGCKKDHPQKQAPYTSVNALMTDGKTLHAICHAAAGGMATFGVCNPDQPWSQMSFARRPGRVLVASEDMDRAPWTRLAPPQALSVSRRAGRLEVERATLAGLPQMPLPSEEAALK